jgi:hypothetical protein
MVVEHADLQMDIVALNCIVWWRAVMNMLHRGLSSFSCASIDEIPMKNPKER